MGFRFFLNLRLKAKGDGARPSRCQDRSPHKLFLRRGRGWRSAGWRRSAGWWRIATRRRAISAIARARWGQFLPLVKLLRRKDGFHLRGHIVTQGFHLGAAVFSREAGVAAQFAYLLIARLKDGLDLRLLVFGEVE